MHRHEKTINGDTFDCSVEPGKDAASVTVGDNAIVVERLGEGIYQVEIEGQRYRAAATSANGTCWVDLDAFVFEVTEPSQDGFSGGADAHAGEKDKAFAPMPGKVVKLLVSVGDEITERQQLLIVEAMKMENPVLAKAAGRVKAINCTAGEQVDTETVLVELELTETPAG